MSSVYICSSSSVSAEENDVFTVYIKDLGPWTKALKNTALGAETTGNATSLLVDVDGFYSQVQSLNSMKAAAGAPRVVIVAGGSGMTSLMGFIQVRFFTPKLCLLFFDDALFLFRLVCVCCVWVVRLARRGCVRGLCIWHFQV